MRFSRLRLNGFKSFVDPTELMISEGLTGVVGPNGCGKSNLLEALRWVMGENRPTAMRGAGMEDVVFAGAASRSARNFAEVALQLDNSDRLAPAGFNDSDILDIVRRITRDAGSAFKLNGKEVRARDVQMLFADASTGAHSPALVRQGQIAELINARPRARRKVLEDAAGIGGLYQRRHEAELKLRGAEQNLERVQDVIDQLAAQLRDLARQARQAQRYRAIGADLRGAEGRLLYRRWYEADAARQRAETELTRLLQEAGRAERASRATAEARETAEQAIPPLREEEAIAAAVLQRLAVEKSALAEREAQARGTVDSLEARIAQLVHDADRESALNRDADDTLERLDAEVEALSAADTGHDDRLNLAAKAVRDASEALAERESALAALTEDAARLAARHQSADRVVKDLIGARDRARSEAERARAAVSEAASAVAAAERAAEDANAEQQEAARLAERAESALIEADEARGEAQAREAEARAARSEAEGELGALSAEAAALARLVERDTAEGGQVLDSVRVTAGFEKALGAALADDLRAPEVGAEAASGWVGLPAYEDVPALPEGARPLSEVVDVPGVLARRIGQVGVVPAGQGAALQTTLEPGQRLVSSEGDLWRWDGFRAGAADAPTAAALRLQQLNRLEGLKHEIAQAEARAAGAASAHDTLTADLKRLTAADAEARSLRREADRRLAEASRAASRAEADRDIAAGKLETQRQAVARHETEAAAAETRLEEALADRASLPDLEVARRAAAEQKTEVEAARISMMTARAAEDELRREGDARRRRLDAIARERHAWRDRLDNAAHRMQELDLRRTELEGRLEEARAAPDELAAAQEALAERIDAAEARRKAAADRLAEGEAALRTAASAERSASTAAGTARETRAAAEARAEAAREALETAAARILEELEVTPEALPEQIDADPDTISEVAVLEAEVTRLRRQRDALGAVNLRAEEDARAVEEEHETLVREKTDLEEAIRTLRGGIAALNREGRERLLTAFEQVNANFGQLFSHLFNGGEARLELVESDDPLDAGLEILCQPPGKKLSTLSLLSGGEQTLTALALIFGVFMANPAPICVLDEVDAPLDDANVARFCDLLDEMTRSTDTRFLIITHHAVTMARMDRLFGVTMQEQGVSQLVSVDLKKAEQMVA